MDHDTIARVMTAIMAEPNEDRQHTMEYYLYKHFIRYVAATAPEPYRSLACQVLTTEALAIGKV